MNHVPTAESVWDLVVVGGGPAGATAAHDAARQGLSVLLLDRDGRIKPGHVVLMEALGGGFSWGAALARW